MLGTFNFSRRPVGTEYPWLSWQMAKAQKLAATVTDILTHSTNAKSGSPDRSSRLGHFGVTVNKAQKSLSEKDSNSVAVSKAKKSLSKIRTAKSDDNGDDSAAAATAPSEESTSGPEP